MNEEAVMPVMRQWRHRNMVNEVGETYLEQREVSKSIQDEHETKKRADLLTYLTEEEVANRVGRHSLT